MTAREHGAARRGEKRKRPGPDRTQRRTLALIKQVQYRSYLRLEQALQPLGVSAVQYRILATLKQRRRMSSAELARLYDVRPQTMFKQIAALEEKALIRKYVSDAHKRVLEIELSAKGESALAECTTRAAAVETQLFHDFTEGELAMYREMMVRLLDAARSRRPSTRLGG
jgi:DNA-binding MarR family transcriptional regulator